MLALRNSESIPIIHSTTNYEPFVLTRHEPGAPYVPLHYSRGAQLCLEGHSASGIFRICTGRAKEYFTSQHGKTAILRISLPGDLIGLEPMIAGTAYATTVEAIESTTAYFITKRDFLGLMRQDETFRLRVAKQLSERCKGAYSSVRQLGFAASIPARVAHFLLRWVSDTTSVNGDQSIRIGLTHEEIGHMIGTVRETVSRTITSFRRRGWIRTSGAKLQIVKRGPLSALAKEQCAIED
jgi:CRP/FNR family cyclic AMP-dependent transcriptional regulator